MAITIATGLPGSAKSYYSTLKIEEWLNRNKWRYFKRTGIVRTIRSNLVLSEAYTNEANDMSKLIVNDDVKVTKEMIHWNETHKFLEYWDDPEELPTMNNCDIIWEEMGAHVDSRSWDQLPMELRRWLQQHRHRGVNIFGNAQDLADIDVAVRRVTQDVLYLHKIMGSRDPTPTSPPVKFVWGLVLQWWLDPRRYDEKDRGKYSTFGSFEFLSKEIVQRYSMFNDIKPAKPQPLRHKERSCPDCGKVKIEHV